MRDAPPDPTQAIIVVDLGFGDCGKGTIVDYLVCARRAHTVVRFNGGPQAGHNVVTPDGRHHTFAQFGSGTFVPGVRTLLSRFMLIEPYAMLNENEHLRSIGVSDPLQRTLIDSRCIVVTPPQQAANRLRELARGPAAHGTCGIGVGESVQDSLGRPELVIRAGEMSDRVTIARKLRAHRDLKLEELRDELRHLESHPRARFSIDTLADASWIDAAVDNYAWLAQHVEIVDDVRAAQVLRQSGTIVFEGAHGALLDERFGFHPHTTWSTTTSANAQALLDEAGFDGRPTRVGVLRTYFTRHGRGPFVTEDAPLAARLGEPHNNAAGWQGQFRIGVFDAVAARYALAAAAGSIDALALTHLDQLPRIEGRVCDAYLGPPVSESPGTFFDLDGTTVREIRVPRSPDLARQQQLTSLLNACRPLVTALDPSEDAFIDFIERALQLRVGITSHGPTAHDKRVRHGHFAFSNIARSQ